MLFSFGPPLGVLEGTACRSVGALSWSKHHLSFGGGYLLCAFPHEWDRIFHSYFSLCLVSINVTLAETNLGILYDFCLFFPMEWCKTFSLAWTFSWTVSVFCWKDIGNTSFPESWDGGTLSQMNKQVLSCSDYKSGHFRFSWMNPGTLYTSLWEQETTGIRYEEEN